MSLGVSSPLRKSPPPPHMSILQLFKGTMSPPSSSSYRQSDKIVKGGTNYTKFPLSSAEEKHVDTYIGHGYLIVRSASPARMLKY